MEVGRLPDLFAGTSGYVRKRIPQGNGDGALAHVPGANSGSSLILHLLITLLIQPSFTAPLLGSTPPFNHMSVSRLPHCISPLLIFDMFHINSPPTHPPFPTHRGFRVISIPIYFLILSLGTCSFVTWDKFFEGNGISVTFFYHPCLSKII